MWHYRHTVLVAMTLAFATTMVARIAISPLVPELTRTFGASTSDFGLALTGMWAAYALSQYPGGVLASRFGERTVVLLALALIAVASVLLAVSPIFPLFAVVTVLLGAAAGLPYSATTSLLSKSFEDVGRAIGIYIAGGPMAGLFVPVLVTAVAAAFGWRVAMLVGAAVALPVFVVIFAGVRPRPEPRGERGGFSLGTALEILRRPQIGITIVIAVGGAFTWQAVASFLPTFLIEYHGVTIQTAGLLFGGYFLVHGLTQPLTGWLSDRIGRDVSTAVTMGSAMVGLTALLVAPGRIVLGAGLVLLGLGMSWGAPVQSRFMDQFGPTDRTIGFGLVRTVYMTVGALGSVVVGVLADLFGWTTAFGLLAILMGMEVVVLAVTAVNDTRR